MEWFNGPDQSQHRRVHIEAQEPRLGVGKNIQKRANDGAERVFAELMERKPLAEKSTRRESLPDGAKVFQGVKRSRAVARGVEQVGHDHVVVDAGRADMTARVGDGEL